MRDNIPLSVILSWPRPNYVDPVTRGHALLVVNTIFISFVYIAVALRVYTRLYIKRWFGFDDWCILIALLFTTGLTAVVILANVEYGWDRHVWDIPFRLIPVNLKVAMAAKILFTLSATFIRASLIAFYYRLSNDSAIHWFRMALHLSSVFNIGICISFTLLGIFICNPVSAYWALVKPPGAKCANEGTATLAVGVINCVADLLVTILPIPIIMALNMPLRQRLQVACLLSLGLVVTCAGVVRTYYIWKSLMDSYDETWFAYPLWISAAVEIHLGVLCACAPALRPLLNDPIRSLSRAISSLKNSSSPNSKNSKNSSQRKSPKGTAAGTAASSTPNASKHSIGSGSNKLKFGRKGRKVPLSTIELSEFDTTVGGSPLGTPRLGGGSAEGENERFDSSLYGVLPRTSDEENLLGVRSDYAMARQSPRTLGNTDIEHETPHNLTQPPAIYNRQSTTSRTAPQYTLQRKGSHPWAVPTSVEELPDTLHEDEAQRSQSSLAKYPILSNMQQAHAQASAR